jgi:hypothetical protein
MSDNFQGYGPHSIATYTGKSFDLSIMDPESITIEDIARGLSMNCRWGGHVKTFCSVAEHSIRVSEQLDDDNMFAGLMHDASEAYLLDMPKPFKTMMPDYVALEEKLMKVIADKFNFQYPLSPVVKAADKFILEWEWEHVKSKNLHVRTMTPQEAESEFLKRFRFLYHSKKRPKDAKNWNWLTTPIRHQ